MKRSAACIRASNSTIHRTLTMVQPSSIILDFGDRIITGTFFQIEQDNPYILVFSRIHSMAVATVRTTHFLGMKHGRDHSRSHRRRFFSFLFFSSNKTPLNKKSVLDLSLSKHLYLSFMMRRNVIRSKLLFLPE